MPSMNNWFRMSSEASPLLPARNPSDYLNTFPIFPLVEALETTNFIHLRWQDLIPRTVSASFDTEPCKSLAFALIVLLELRKRQIAWKGQYPANSYEQWTEEEAHARDVEILEDKMSEFWETFLTQYRSSSDLHDVLWTPFLLKKDKSRTIRGVKFFFSICNSEHNPLDLSYSGGFSCGPRWTVKIHRASHCIYDHVSHVEIWSS